LVCFLWVFSKVNADETFSDTIFVGEVGTKVVHEDDEVKVWEMILQPGEKSVLHKHDLSYAFYVLQGSSVEVRDESDKLLTTININAGETLSFDIDGDDLVDSTGTYRINRTHSAKNIGNSVFREILIEKKVSATV